MHALWYCIDTVRHYYACDIISSGKRYKKILLYIAQEPPTKYHMQTCCLLQLYPN